MLTKHALVSRVYNLWRYMAISVAVGMAEFSAFLRL